MHQVMSATSCACLSASPVSLLNVNYSMKGKKAGRVTLGGLTPRPSHLVPRVVAQECIASGRVKPKRLCHAPFLHIPETGDGERWLHGFRGS